MLNTSERLLEYNNYKRRERRDEDFDKIGAIKIGNKKRLAVSTETEKESLSLITESYFKEELDKILAEENSGGFNLFFTVSLLRDFSEYEDELTAMVSSNNGVYEYDETSSCTDDGLNVIKPNEVSESGRWLLKASFADYNKISNRPKTSYMLVEEDGQLINKSSLDFGDIESTENLNGQRVKRLDVDGNMILLGGLTLGDDYSFPDLSGNEGEVLVLNQTGNLKWGSSGSKLDIIRKFTNYQIEANDDLILLDGTSSNIIATLPKIDLSIDGSSYSIKCINNTNNVSLECSTGDVFDDTTTIENMFENHLIKVVADESTMKWVILKSLVI